MADEQAGKGNGFGQHVTPHAHSIDDAVSRVKYMQRYTSHHQKEKTKMKGSVSEHIGERWGRLEITGVQWDDRRRRNHVVCRCDCGNTIVNQYIHLKNGKVQSCGCYLDEKNKAGHERMVKREQERRDRYETMQAEWARRREEREADGMAKTGELLRVGYDEAIQSRK